MPEIKGHGRKEWEWHRDKGKKTQKIEKKNEGKQGPREEEMKEMELATTQSNREYQ
jgi:hypothetical protein